MTKVLVVLAACLCACTARAPPGGADKPTPPPTGGTASEPTPATCNRPPVASITVPADRAVDVAPGATLVLEGTCADPDGDDAVGAWRLDGTDLDAAPTVGPRALLFPAPGIFTVTRSCRDARGAVSNAVALTVVVSPPATEAWFVDSVNGNDENDGRSEAAPLRSIRALLAKPLAAAAAVYLLRGSYWRETLYGLPHDATVRAYGAGPRPVFDGSDVIPAGSFSRTPGRANVYQATVGYEGHITGGLGGFRNRVWEAGALLRYVADLDACEAMPGSWTGNGTPLAPTETLYVHPSVGGDPATNGVVYEYPARPYGVHGGQYPGEAIVRQIVGVESRRHAHHDGGIVSAGYVRDCVADDGGAGPTGPAHTFWVNGLAEDCVARSAAGNPFISFGNDIPSVHFRRCQAVCPSGSGIGFFFHTGAYDVAHMKRYVIEHSEVEGCSGFAAGNSAHLVALIGPRGTGIEQLAHFSFTETFLVLGGTATTVGSPATTTIVRWDGAPSSASARMKVRGLGVVADHVAHYGAIVAVNAGAGAMDVANTTLVFTNPGAPENWRTGIANHEGPLAVRNSVIVGAATPIAGATVAADANVYEDPQFIGDLAAGDLRTSTSSPACELEAGAEFYGDASDRAALGL